MAEQDRVIATVEKNATEEIRVSLSQYKGYDLAAARVWFRDAETEELRPTRKGITFRVALLPEIVAALQQAEAEARAAGTLTDEDDTS